MCGTSGDFPALCLLMVPAHDSAHISPFYLSMQTYTYKYYFYIYAWIPLCFFLLVFTYILKMWHTKCGVMWCKKAGDDIKPESWLVARDKHLQKGSWGSSNGETWECMLSLRRNLRALPQVKSAAREQDSWNLCGGDSVLFHSVSEGNKLCNCSLSSNLCACYTTQHNWTEQERSQDIKCSQVSWKSAAGQRQEVFAPF